MEEVGRDNVKLLNGALKHQIGQLKGVNTSALTPLVLSELEAKTLDASRIINAIGEGAKLPSQLVGIGREKRCEMLRELDLGFAKAVQRYRKLLAAAIAHDKNAGSELLSKLGNKAALVGVGTGAVTGAVGGTAVLTEVVVIAGTAFPLLWVAGGACALGFFVWNATRDGEKKELDRDASAARRKWLNTVEAYERMRIGAMVKACQLKIETLTEDCKDIKLPNNGRDKERLGELDQLTALLEAVGADK